MSRVLYICSVRDSAVKAFAPPFAVPSLGLALRSFEDQVKNQSADNVVSQHPEDFELFHIGLFNEETGDIERVNPVSVARAKDFRAVV